VVVVVVVEVESWNLLDTVYCVLCTLLTYSTVLTVPGCGWRGCCRVFMHIFSTRRPDWNGELRDAVARVDPGRPSSAKVYIVHTAPHRRGRLVIG
jgi:hypothetical protein